MWKFLSSTGTPPDSPSHPDKAVAIGRKKGRDSAKKISPEKGKQFSIYHKLNFLFCYLKLAHGK